MKKNTLFAVTLLCLFATFVLAQGQDFSKIEIKVTKVAGNVYMLEGAGGNIGVSVGADGVLIVDDQYAPMADKIKAALKGIADGKLKFVINTHWHGDHSGGNAIFSADSAIIAHANVRKRLIGANPEKPNSPKQALPLITFDQTMSVHFNGEEIKAVYYPNGHTDGDGVIHFIGSNVVHMGDDFVSGMFPFIDTNSGGSLEGLIKNVAAVIAKLPADVKIIPGHGPLSTLADLKAFHTMLLETTDFVRQQIKAGKTLDEIKAAGLPAKWDSWGNGFMKTPNWIQTIHRNLSK